VHPAASRLSREATIEAVAAYGALVLSIVALAWQLRDRSASYLRLKVAVERQAEATVVSTSVENPSPRVRTMTKIFLLVGPEDEHPVDTFNAVASAPNGGATACCAVDFEDFDLPGRLTGDGRRLLIPLDYYIEENPEVGDEALACQTSIGPDELRPGGSYSVRFYVFGHRWRGARIHRKVQAVLVLPGTRESVAEPSLPVRRTCGQLKGCGVQVRAARR
jgi:hypothetical protein